MRANLIAFTGFAGAGKDEAAKVLIGAGYQRCAFGDIIKKQVDPIVQKYLGFSAFTEDRTQKERIRRTLESWGEDNYDAILAELFATMPPKAVNTRLCRPKEARIWRERGGVLLVVSRAGKGPATEKEERWLDDLYRESLVDGVISNDGTIRDLHEYVANFFELS